MGKSSIEWTDYTSNPIGIKGSLASYCVKVSPGCKNCYAETMSRRLAAICGDEIFFHYKATKTPPVLDLRTKVLEQWKTWKKGRKIFVSSMSDVFGEFVDIEWIYAILDAMIASPQHTFQVLTKRAQRARNVVTMYCDSRGIKCLPINIWIGTSVEDQETANERIPELIKTKCSVRFLSCEPLLEKVNIIFAMYQDIPIVTPENRPNNLLHWVIAGGESGHNARPLHPDIVREIRDQCISANIPFLFKQWGEWVPWEESAQQPFWESQHGLSIDGHAMLSFEDMEESKRWDTGMWCVAEGLDICLFEKVGKNKSGNRLDGKQYLEFPHPQNKTIV